MKSIVCWALGHEYKVVQVFSRESRKLCCDRCKSEFAMNDRVRVLVPWSDEFEQFYRDFGNVLQD